MFSKSFLIITAIVLVILIVLFYWLFSDDLKSEIENAGSVASSGSALVVPPVSGSGGNPATFPPKPSYEGKKAFANRNGVQVIRSMTTQQVYKTSNKGEFIGSVVGQKYAGWYDVSTPGGVMYVLALYTDLK